MRPFKNNHKRQKFRNNNDRNLNRVLDTQSLVSKGNFQRKSHRSNNQNASRLIEKYNNLAREALSNGDKILSENYLQHADHFSRLLILQELNKANNNNVIEQNFKKNNIEEIQPKQTDTVVTNKITEVE